ncbi:MAG: NifU N-terminal domain-containing protein, partial [Bacteroidota bacterium]|nr:NifU N-terminal domain-containing protein [Bacteroidota bacterium]MDX5506597.1 NifU N-terminal domain-containing protein [Bacteroidota bacterium]
MEVKKVPVSIYAEITPNPAVMKFVANQLLIEQDSVEFKNIDEAKPSPLAQKLFHFPFVKEVFISGNYIAISKYDIAEWQDVTLELRNFISEWLQEGKPVLTEKVATHSG